MSEAFLGSGSTEPAKVPGKYRLYGLKLSPTTQQVRIVLHAKKVPYDLVNINPRDVPDWYKKIQPEGKFPALHTGDQLIVDTAPIVQFIDEKFPEPVLFIAGSDKKAVMKQVLDGIEPLAKEIGLLMTDKNATVSQEVKQLIVHFNEKLTSLDKPFFGGDSPGVTDFLIFPWLEKGDVISALRGQSADSKEKQSHLTGMNNWKAAMKKVKEVQDTSVSTEEFLSYLK